MLQLFLITKQKKTETFHHLLARGKKICYVLRQVRQQIAAANGIEYSPHECLHVGECRGTCPACEAEMRYLERSLMDKYGNGFASRVAGMTILNRRVLRCEQS